MQTVTYKFFALALIASAMLSSTIELSPGAALIDTTGNLQFSATHVSLVEEVRGNLLIAGLSDSAAVDIIGATRGNIILCGVDVAAIESHTRGNVIVVNGDVGQLYNIQLSIDTILLLSH